MQTVDRYLLTHSFRSEERESEAEGKKTCGRKEKQGSSHKSWIEGEIKA